MLIILLKTALITGTIAGVYFGISFLYEKLLTKELVMRVRLLSREEGKHIIIDM